MRLHIKNMVCPRCISAVEDILAKLQLDQTQVSLGAIDFNRDLTVENRQILQQELHKIGFEVLEDSKETLIKEIKVLLLEMINKPNTQKISSYLSDTLHVSYATLSHTFSQSEGITVEKYFIQLKIEKVKELLSYNYSLKEIANQLQYSSVAHLSKQFKEITGLSPTEYKNDILQIPRRFLDEV